MTRLALPAVLAALLALPPAVPAQGDLRRVQASFHPGPKFFLPEWHSPRATASPVGFGPNAGEAGAGLGWLALGLGVVAAAGATAPVWVPHAAYDAGFDVRGWFPPSPYPRADRRYLVAGAAPAIPCQGDDYLESDHVKPWALRLSADLGDDFDGLRRAGGQLFLDTSIYRLGFLADGNYYRERTPAGTDDALVSTYNLTWRFTQSDRLLMHLGAGVRLWTAHGQTDGGPNFLYRADLFPEEPLHLTGVFEVGTIRSALVLHGQVQVGYTFGHGEVFAGFDVLRVKKVPLYSPTVGIRLWF